MNAQLSNEEGNLMIQLFSKIVTLKELDEYMDWLDEQRELELETLRDALPY